MKEAERKASLRTLVRRKFDKDLEIGPFNDFMKYQQVLDGRHLSITEGLNATAEPYELSGSPLTTLSARQMRVDQARAISQMLLD